MRGGGGGGRDEVPGMFVGAVCRPASRPESCWTDGGRPAPKGVLDDGSQAGVDWEIFHSAGIGVLPDTSMFSEFVEGVMILQEQGRG